MKQKYNNRHWHAKARHAFYCFWRRAKDYGNNQNLGGNNNAGKEHLHVHC